MADLHGHKKLDHSKGSPLVKLLRKEGFTFDQISRHTGLSGAFLSDIEKGHRNPSLLHEVILARFLCEYLVMKDET